VTDTLVADLFDRHHLAVYRYFRRMTGQHELAQDLAQETYFRVVRRLAAGAQLRNEAAYLFQIAHHVLVDYWRTTAAAPSFEGLVDVISVDPPQRAALTLQEALVTLSERDRETFVLREVDGLSYAEIAAVHESTLESVRSRLRRARARLRRALGVDLGGAIAPPDEEGDV
jgi:RNA polymerase sigma-70 factor (ECF subfamily)